MTTFASALGATSRVFARSRKHPFARPQVVFGVVIVAFWIIVMIGADWIAPYGPLADTGSRLLAPSMEHLFGTDALGRDVFSRTLHGARLSLPVAAAVIAVAVIVGCVLGSIAGYFGGILDSIIMRFADMTMAFPPILLAMAVTAALGPGLVNALIALVIVWWPTYARLIRGQILSIKQREFVESAVAIGASRWRILGKHVLPHSSTPIMVNATIDLGQAIILVASLSFLGLGALPPSPEWGAMITDGAKNFYQWWIAVGPGLAILSIVLGINFLGDGLRDALDVTSRRR